MTVASKARAEIVRGALRNYLAFREGAARGIDQVDGPESICFHDLTLGMGSLDLRQRQAAWFGLVLDLRVRDVAERLSVSVGTAHRLMDGAVDQLANYLLPTTEGTA